MTGRSYKRGSNGIRQGARHRSGFTLVELLVVVSIIALLIAILLPSLKKARAQAKNVACQAGLRSMGQAFMMYQEAYNGVLPPYMDNYGNQNRWPVPFHQGGIIKAQLARFDASGNVLKAPESSIFICPEERAPRIIKDWRSGVPAVDRVEVGGSFAFTQEVHRKPDGNLDLTALFSRKVDTCRRPSEVYAVMENYQPLLKPSTQGWCFNRGADKEPPTGPTNSRAFYFTYRDFDGNPVQPTPATLQLRVIGGHHLGMGNALAFDTHVERYKPDKVSFNQVSWTRWKGSDVPPGGF
jgi:prepilin-type N-terminal cleavage/methylation domain-containing protein